VGIFEQRSIVRFDNDMVSLSAVSFQEPENASAWSSCIAHIARIGFVGYEVSI
jgi:hypothetical protein